jgi:hypothetical protein
MPPGYFHPQGFDFTDVGFDDLGRHFREPTDKKPLSFQVV